MKILYRTLRHLLFLAITVVLFAGVSVLIQKADPTSPTYDLGFLQRPFVAAFNMAVMLQVVWMLFQLGFTTLRKWLEPVQNGGDVGGFEAAWAQLTPAQQCAWFLGVLLVLFALFTVMLVNTPV